MAELEGRRSGRTHVVPLACVMVEDSILLTVRKGRHPTNEYLRSALANVAKRLLNGCTARSAEDSLGAAIASF